MNLDQETSKWIARMNLGFGLGDSPSFRNLAHGVILQGSHNGQVAVFLANADSPGLSPENARNLAVTLREFEESSPFAYASNKLSEQQKALLSSEGKNDPESNAYDSIVYILGGSEEALRKEMYAAQNVLAAMGLRPMGAPVNDLDEELTVSVKNGAELLSEALSHVSAETKEDVAEEEFPAVDSQTEDTASASGAMEEWIVLRSIATVAGCPNQPKDSVRQGSLMFGQDPKEWKNQVPFSIKEWERQMESGPLNDASKIRAFISNTASRILENLDAQEKRNAPGSLDEARHREDASWREMLRSNLRQVIDSGDQPYANNARSMESLFERLAFESEAEKDRSRETLKDTLNALRYASRLLDVVESTAAKRHLLYLRNRDAIDPNLVSYPASFDVYADRDGRAPGRLLTNDSPFSRVYPLLLQETDYEGQKSLALIPGGAVHEVLDQKSLNVVMQLPKTLKYIPSLEQQEDMEIERRRLDLKDLTPEEARKVLQEYRMTSPDVLESPEEPLEVLPRESDEGSATPRASDDSSMRLDQ